MATFAIIEMQGKHILKDIVERFQRVKILEHYNTYYKFRVPRGEYSIGYLFGFMQELVSNYTFLNFLVNEI